MLSEVKHMNGKTRYLYNVEYIQSPRKFGQIRLYQIGRRYCESSATIEAHLHLDWFELTIVTGGAGTVITNGEKCSVKAGDIYLSFPCEVHEIHADAGANLDYDFFAFGVDEGAFLGDLDSITREHHSGLHRVFRDEKISGLVANAILEFSQTDAPHSEQVLTDTFNLAVAYLIRSFSNIVAHSPGVSEAEILCFKIMNYVDTHIYALENTAEISESFNYNYRYLSGLFKKTTGKNLSEYVRTRRLEAARALILEGKKKINEIAELFGYTPYSFSKAFKAQYGTSPKNVKNK